MARWLTVIGIGEDGFSGLGQQARNAIASAVFIFGGERHLALVAGHHQAEVNAWPIPFSKSYQMIEAMRSKPVVVLASGDPMFFGMGASLMRHFTLDEVEIIPFPSSYSLAAARMGWALQDVECLSVHGRPLAILQKHIHAGNKLLVLSDSGKTPLAAAKLLHARGFGSSQVNVLEHLGGEKEHIIRGQAASWQAQDCADLNILAIECIADEHSVVFPLGAGLSDEHFINDGQLTKQDIRAVTLARLMPQPHQLLWDVGAGCGSISIEWMLMHPTCRAIALEANAQRQEFILKNAENLGVPALQLVRGKAPEALTGLEAPDAIFIGGGVTGRDVLQSCWGALKPGGRLVANAVTLQSEMALHQWRAQYGGELVRISMAQAAELGSFDVWRQALPVTILCSQKPK
ncbi:precorrin-6y C5,15-methyltransferase (decarboxylating) subunit CbiE [Paenochrobactrum pullorum]|uniref:precorrin-6y C5,15-methyltransferase (decarboxylating) subunit CbiE n=1 Tax=Paenochrobactrum pullorum TaxID=1324351 RepID=UPI0035BBA201